MIYTIKTLSKLTGCPYATLRGYVQRGVVPYELKDGTYQFPDTAVKIVKDNHSRKAGRPLKDNAADFIFKNKRGGWSIKEHKNLNGLPSNYPRNIALHMARKCYIEKQPLPPGIAVKVNNNRNSQSFYRRYQEGETAEEVLSINGSVLITIDGETKRYPRHRVYYPDGTVF